MANKIIIKPEVLLKKLLIRDKKKLSSIISDKFGIINAFLERFELEKYKLYMVQNLSAQTKILFNLSREISSGGLGIDFQRKNAFLASMGESIERYCVSFFDKTDIILTTYEKIPQKYRTDKFNSFTQNQINQFKLKNPYKDRIYWTKLRDYSNRNQIIYWPSSLIYLPFEKQNPVGECTSTGLAANFSIDKALISGLFEIIERDAIMNQFIGNLPFVENDKQTCRINPLIIKIQKHYNMRIFDLYSDLPIAVKMVIIWRKYKGKIHYGIGASARLDSDEAITKAATESLFTYFYSHHFKNLRQINLKKIDALYEHFLYYQEENFEKLIRGKISIIPYTHKKFTLPTLLDSIEKSGYRIYFKELTTSDIKATGFRVVKVLIPGFLDINKKFGCIPKSERLRDIAWSKYKIKINFKDSLHPLP